MNKSLLSLFLVVAAGAQLNAQTGIGTTTPASSSALDISSTTGGFLIPRMTASQRSAIASPALGLQVFQVDGNPGIYYYNGVNWQSVSKGTSVDNAGYPPNYGTVTTFAGSGTAATTNGTGTGASFNGPVGVTVDAAGNVYTADYNGNVIRKITPAGVVSSLAGGSLGSANGTGAAASFNSPDDVAVDASGNVYVADYLNHMIRKVSAAGVVTTLAGSTTYGNTDGTGTAASFHYPDGVAVDASGNVYVADDGNNLIRKITPAGVVTTLAGSGSIGAVNGTGTSASFFSPKGVGVDAAGNVYVADYGNHLVRKITPGGLVTTLAGSGVSGNADGLGTAASFSNPIGIAVDASGNVYVGDYGGARIRRITATGIVTTLAGSGTIGNTDGVGAAASFNSIYHVAVDASGNIYVAEYSNNKIRKISTQ